MEMSSRAEYKNIFNRFSVEDTCLDSDGNERNDSRYSDIICKIDTIIEKLTDDPGCSVVSDVYELFNAMTQHIIKENIFINMLDFPHANQHFENHIQIYSTVASLCFKCIQKQKIGLAELNNVRSIWVEHIGHHDRLLENYLLS